jgi:hypothetical protein
MDLWFLGLGTAAAAAIVVVTALIAVLISMIFDRVGRVRWIDEDQ